MVFATRKLPYIFLQKRCLTNRNKADCLGKTSRMTFDLSVVAYCLLTISFGFLTGSEVRSSAVTPETGESSGGMTWLYTGHTCSSSSINLYKRLLRVFFISPGWSSEPRFHNISSSTTTISLFKTFRPINRKK